MLSNEKLVVDFPIGLPAHFNFMVIDGMGGKIEQFKRENGTGASIDVDVSKEFIICGDSIDLRELHTCKGAAGNRIGQPHARAASKKGMCTQQGPAIVSLGLEDFRGTIGASH